MGLLNNSYKILLIGKNVIALSFTAFLIIAIKYAWYPILPVYLIELNANNFQVAFSYTLLALSTTLMQFLGGMLSDIFGRKNLIVIPTFALPICYLLSANSYHWIPLIIFLTIANSLSALQLPSFYSLIAESVKKTKRGIAYGIFQLFMVLGMTIGPVIGMILILRINIKNIFYIASFVNFICALVRTIWLKETHNNRYKTDKFDSFKKLFNKKILNAISSLSSLFLVFNLTIKGPFISLYAYEVMSISKFNINLFFAIGGFAAIVYSLLGGRIIDILGNKKVLSFSVLGLGIFMLLWSFSTSLLLIILFFAISYISYQSCQIAYDSFLADITHKQSRGLVIGFIGTCTGLIGSLGPYLGGYLKTQFGVQSPFWAALIFALITLFLLTYKKK